MQNYHFFACGSVWVWNLVSDIKGEHRLRVFENREDIGTEEGWSDGRVERTA
jgi:hypothetical protein